MTIFVALILSLLVTILSLRAKTWQRFALKDKLMSTSSSFPADELKVGDVGVAISRLSPMGKIEVDGKSYEAKSTDVYIDPKIRVQVVGFENFTVIVRRAE